MAASIISPMPNEICWKIWIRLFSYQENTTQHLIGLSRPEIFIKALRGLVDNPNCLIQDPDNADLASPVKEEQLIDVRYWLSSEFFLKILETAAKAIGGFLVLKDAQSKRFQFIRLFSPNRQQKIAGFINIKFNKTKNPFLFAFA